MRGREAMKKTRYRAVGLMCGTSVDAIDVALIETDGHAVQGFGPAASEPLDPALRQRIRAAMAEAAELPASVAPPPAFSALSRDIAEHHARAIAGAGIDLAGVDIVGFHGQTIRHAPHLGLTWQLGDAAYLARRLRVPVVGGFRLNDVAAGGEGAPLVPLYHQALTAGLRQEIVYPVAILNIGGVANLTWIGGPEGEVIACDTGPGNALLDDWVASHGLGDCDLGGRIAAAGRVDEARLERWLLQPFFARRPPKSLDRDAFAGILREEMPVEDGAATFTAFTAAAVARTVDCLPAAPRRWFVTGGGRHNPTLMGELAARLGVSVVPVEDVGWRGDYLEAEAFGFLAVRSLLKLPLSLPSTTGAPMPMSGGKMFMP